MDERDAQARAAAEAQHLALLAEHLLARAASRDAAGPVERERAEDLRRAAQRACVRAVTTLSGNEANPGAVPR